MIDPLTQLYSKAGRQKLHELQHNKYIFSFHIESSKAVRARYFRFKSFYLRL